VTTVHDLDFLAVGDLVFAVAAPTDRKTLQITVDRDASLILRAPAAVSRERAEQFIESKRSWVYRKLAEKDALVGPTVTKQFVDGEGFAYLGRSHRLLLDDSEDGVRLDRGRFRMSHNTARRGAEAMRRWYTTTGQAWLQRRVRPWTQRLTLANAEVAVLDLGHRWGSARSDRKVNIHWATLQLPPSIIDYVLAHELAHLREPQHNPDFWSLVAAVMPDFESRKETLRHVGRTIWLGNPPGR
jgi:predicted metal-dependent hydrolase